MGHLDTKPVIRVEMAGAVTSFRYTFVMQGFHPTYEMPPPSTIYGHICSAVGDWIEPDEKLQFGYHFTYAAKFVDYKEHLHFSDPIQPFPFDRELLFEPRMTLYVTQTELLDAFLHPYFPVVLGRSQDLMTYQKIEMVELERRERGYFEHTLLPQSMAAHIDKGTIAVTMPRYIDAQRHPYHQGYAMLKSRAIWPPPAPDIDPYDDDELVMPLVFEREPLDLWVDPLSPQHHKDTTLQRAIWLHRFDQGEA